MCTGQTGNGLGILVRKIPVMEFIGSELQRQVLKRNAKDVLLEFDTKQEYDRDFGMQLKRTPGICLSLHGRCNLAQ